MYDNLPDDAMTYQILLEGRLDSRWESPLGEVTIAYEDDGDNVLTVITASVVDQAALYGLLRKVRDLAIPLLSVTRVQPPGHPPK